MTTLPLSPIANVEYTISPTSAPRRGFNLGLITGTSPVISTVTRLKIYTSVADMVADGFNSSMPEYIAAQFYFSSPGKPTQVAIGRQATGETALQAIQACRTKNSEWYTVYSTSAATNDQNGIAAWAEAAIPESLYILQSADSAVLNNTNGNLFATLETAEYSRTMGFYSTVPHAVASIMGYAMGQTSDATRSAYTLAYKQMPGVTPEDLTTQQVINIQTNNGNVYINRANFYDGFERGTMFNGGWFDEIIYLDKLVNEMRLNVADLLFQVSKVPQTEEGVNQLMAVIERACQKFVRLGFIAPGIWNGQNILALTQGDTLSAGYLVQSDPIDEQSPADRDARKSPNIYVAAKLAGAIQSVFIRIQANR
jgi:hypothetical protein